MRVKNNKIFLYTFILLSWNIVYLFIQRNTSNFIFVNYIFWIVSFIFCLISFKNNYQRNKYKSVIFKDVVIFLLFYIIVYYLLGFIIGFKKSPLDFSLLSIISNLSKFVLLRIVTEIVKYFFVRENSSKISIFIVTLLFIYLNIDIVYLISLFDNSIELFKYVSSNVIPIFVFGIVGTYLIIYSDLKTNLLLQIIPLILTYTISISPNMDWYMYSIFHVIFLFVLYLWTKYEIEKREKNETKAKDSVFGLLPTFIVFSILILFVLGVFKYVPIGVMSNSMENIFVRGDIVVYEKINDIDILKEQDIICYQLDNIKVMHRIVKINEYNGKKYFVTKGDNLTTNDPLRVSEEQIIGRIKFVLPKIGYPSVWLYEYLK